MPVRSGTPAGQGNPAPTHDSVRPPGGNGLCRGQRGVQAKQHPVAEVHGHHGRAASKPRMRPRHGKRPRLTVEDHAHRIPMVSQRLGRDARQPGQGQTRDGGSPPPWRRKIAQGRGPGANHGDGQAEYPTLDGQPRRFRTDVDTDGRRRARHGVRRRLLSSPRKHATDGAVAASHAQARRKTSVPFVPPKPKLFLTATSIFISRAVLAQ